MTDKPKFRCLSLVLMLWVLPQAVAAQSLLDALQKQQAQRAPAAVPAPAAPPAAPAAPLTVPPAPTFSPAPAAAETPPTVVKENGVRIARPAAATARSMPGTILRFENADIHDIVQAILGDALHLNYMVDPTVQGRITLQSTGNVSAADIYNILENALQLHGISIVRDGKLYKVIRDVQANRDVGMTAAGENSPVTQVIPLQFVQASALLASVKSVLGQQALVANDPTNRHLIVVDRAQNVAKVIDLIALLDVDYLARVRIRLVDVAKGDATELAKEMETLFRTSGLFNWPGTEGNKVYFLPITRMNAILVAAANDSMIEAAEKWIRTLDDEPKNGLGAMVHVYPVNNSNATHLANLLRQLYGGAATQTTGPAQQPSSSLSSPTGQTQTPATGPTATTDPNRVVLRGSGTGGGALAGNVQIIADEATNSLVIRASPQDYLQIRRIIDRIDTVARQVLIQVMVAEVGLSDKLQYGVEWWLKNLTFSANGKSWAAQAGLDSGLMSPAADANPVTTAPADGVASGFNYLIFNKAGDITGLFNLLATNTDVNILSAPHVLASDGKTAKIEVGSEEPVITQTVSTPTTTSTTGITTSNSVQYRPTGILLEVKPTINASGLVNLNMTQEVSSRGTNVSVGGSIYPSFTKRKVSTEVTIEEGKTLVVAGLIQDRGDKSNQGVPLLKDVPIFGTLFGTQKNQTDKTELLIAITPFVVRNKGEAERISREFRESLAGLKQRMGDIKLMTPAEQQAEAVPQ